MILQGLSGRKNIAFRSLKINRVSFSHDIDEQIVIAFGDCVEKIGGPKCVVLEASIRTFCALPEDLQLSLKKPNITTEQAGKILAAYFVQQARQRIQESLTPEQQDYLTEMTIRTAEHLARKKKTRKNK